MLFSAASTPLMPKNAAGCFRNTAHALVESPVAPNANYPSAVAGPVSAGRPQRFSGHIDEWHLVLANAFRAYRVWFRVVVS